MLFLILSGRSDYETVRFISVFTSLINTIG